MRSNYNWIVRHAAATMWKTNNHYLFLIHAFHSVASWSATYFKLKYRKKSFFYSEHDFSVNRKSSRWRRKQKALTRTVGAWTPGAACLSLYYAKLMHYSARLMRCMRAPRTLRIEPSSKPTCVSHTLSPPHSLTLSLHASATRGDRLQLQSRDIVDRYGARDYTRGVHCAPTLAARMTNSALQQS